jgi:hypothetical protein
MSQYDEYNYRHRLEQFRASREAHKRQEEFERMTLLAQFQRFKLCPCIAQGRYSTCCKQLENVRDGFFHINGRAQ